ncbi:hypothetical protein CY35_06G035100 [Sphagnum magellanicum]|nr:hypothetical protein CY35_06G035100 [Sphagnum magellanicum]
MPPQLRKKGAAPSRNTPFNKAHLVTFGLEITQSLMSSTGNSSVVTSVRCLFCKRIGRETVDVDDNSRKRLRTTNVKIFEGPPFRKENFANHLKSQHADDFEKYSSLSTERKKKFFNVNKRTQDSIKRYLNASQTALCFPVSKDIVEVIIGDMFFKPKLGENNEWTESITKANALKLFNTSAVIGHHKDAFGNAQLGGLNDHEVGKMVRVNVGSNLQVLSDVLNDDEVWAFSLAGDGSTHHDTSFFDVRIRTCIRGVLFNVHLVCVRFFERHTATNIFNMVCKLLDHIYSRWRHKLVSVSTDGENTMTGWLGGFVTLMAQQAVYEVLRIWCPLHQIDLVIKDATCKISDDTFSKITHTFTVHLRKQKNLQLQMGSKCPKDTSRWAHFQAQLEWLLQRRVQLIEWVEKQQPDSAPTTVFWIIVATINPLAKACCETLAALQHRDIALSQQTSKIEALVANLLLMIDIQHGDDNQIMVRADQMDDTVFEFELWSVTVDAVLVHVKDQGTWVKDLYLSLDKNDQLDLLREITLYTLHLVSGLSIVQAKRDFRNNAAAELAPPVFPQQLIKMRTNKFIEDVLDPRREMLMAAWGQERVDRIEDEHRALVVMCRNSTSLQASINGHTHQTMFNDA